MIRKPLTEDEIFNAAMAALGAMDFEFSELAARAIACEAILRNTSAKGALESIIDEWATNHVEKQCAIANAFQEALARSDAELGDHDPGKERRAMTPKMRLSVIQADEYKCRACGASATTAQLHVDHILPIKRGGKTVFENLQTLCADCNLAKSTNVIDMPERARK